MAGAGTGGQAFSHLEHRISMLSDVLAERTQSHDGVPTRLEAMLESLHDKIEQNSRGNGDAFSHLEHRIAVLADTLADRAQFGAAAPSRLARPKEDLLKSNDWLPEFSAVGRQQPLKSRPSATYARSCTAPADPPLR